MTAEDTLHANELWHERNLVFLQQSVDAAQHGDARAMEHRLQAFFQEEIARLGDRARLMQSHHIEQAPHLHEARERKLRQALVQAIAEQREKAAA